MTHASRLFSFLCFVVCLTLCPGLLHAQQSPANTAPAPAPVLTQNIDQGDEIQPDFNPTPPAAPTSEETFDFLRGIKQSNDIPANNTPLAQKHISDQELVDFIRLHLTTLFNAEGGQLQNIIAEKQHIFTAEGFTEYQQFLRDTGLYDLNMKYYKNFSSILVSPPAIINDQPLNGYYKWLVSCPILVSVYDGNTQAAKTSEAQRDRMLASMENNKQTYMLQLQITRLETDNNTRENIAIESVVLKSIN